MKRMCPAWAIAAVALAAAVPASAARDRPDPLPSGLRVTHSFRLGPSGGGDARGVGVIGRLRGRLTASVVAWGLPKLGSNEIYVVWLYNSRRDARMLGGRRSNAAGELSGTGPLPRRLRRVGRYRFLDVSIQPNTNDTRHSGRSVLRGRIE